MKNLIILIIMFGFTCLSAEVSVSELDSRSSVEKRRERAYSKWFPAKEYQKRFEENAKNGLMPVYCQLTGEQLRVIFIDRIQKGTPFLSYHGMNKEGLIEKDLKLKGDGYQILSACPFGKRYMATWVKERDHKTYSKVLKKLGIQSL